MIVSPVDNISEVVLVKEITPEFIIREYEKLDIDVSNYFLGISKVKVYKCKKSGYIFFYPFELAGDGFFYEQLMDFAWYYSPWKWEHEVCKNLVGSGFEILEVGCAKGEFLNKLREELRVNGTGLELNKKAIVEGRKKGVNILDETIQHHAKQNGARYDIVCSFQVLEHISDVNSFIQAQIDCLKENGKLVIAVPNNNSFIKYDSGGVLNLPQHHMGLWNPDSIRSLEKVFNVILVEILSEPLQEVHFQWFYNNQIRNLKSNNQFVGKTIEKFTRPFYMPALRLVKNFIKGHTMVAIFQK